MVYFGMVKEAYFVIVKVYFGVVKQAYLVIAKQFTVA